VVSGQRYAPATIDHFQYPRNVGRMLDADAVGRVDDPERETMISLYLKIDSGRIARATFRTFGCSACIAASSMATELLIGRRLTSIAILDAHELNTSLGGLPDDKHYCADLVAEAAQRAIKTLSTQNTL
jgi:NifU-like protein involved in Fe-S cluster formation